MPFTFSHPAIIMPFAKLNPRWFSATGLIIGSMAPDFEFFINMKLQKVHGHTFEGMFYYDLPIAIILAFVFHNIVRDPLINNSPQPIKANFGWVIGMNWNQWFAKYWYVYLYSAMLGIFSHIFWDGFTHAAGFFGYQPFPFLLKEVEFFFWNVPVHVIGQMISTIVGGIVVLIVLVFPKQKTYLATEWKNMIQYWVLVTIIAILVMLVRDMQSIGDLIATSISGGLIGLIVAPRIMRRFKKYETRKILNKEET